MIAAAILAAAAGAAAPAPAAEDAAPMALVGQASHRIAFWTLYDAYLYAPEGDFEWDRPFALTLQYRRAFTAEQFADTSVEEMARMTGRDEAAFAPLREDLVGCFADVKDGDRITGESLSADRAVFTHNGERTCELERAGFRQNFFGIWLGEDSRLPNMTRKLKGGEQ